MRAEDTLAGNAERAAADYNGDSKTTLLERMRHLHRLLMRERPIHEELGPGGRELHRRLRYDRTGMRLDWAIRSLENNIINIVNLTMTAGTDEERQFLFTDIVDYLFGPGASGVLADGTNTITLSQLFDLIASTSGNIGIGVSVADSLSGIAELSKLSKMFGVLGIAIDLINVGRSQIAGDYDEAFFHGRRAAAAAIGIFVPPVGAAYLGVEAAGAIAGIHFGAEAYFQQVEDRSRARFMSSQRIRSLALRESDLNDEFFDRWKRAWQ